MIVYDEEERCSSTAILTVNIVKQSGKISNKSGRRDTNGIFSDASRL